MNKKLINWIGLAGILSFVSYLAATIFAPMAFPGYDWMSQAVSDLSAETAPSRMLWERISAFYNVGGIVCITCVSVFVSENKVGTRLFRTGLYLFNIMELISCVGFKMFPLVDAGKDIASFQEIMHIAVTAAVVLLSIASLTVLIVAGAKDKRVRDIGSIAAVALGMMFIGAIGTAAIENGALPQSCFGIVERFSLFSATGFNAIMGLFLFGGFKKTSAEVA